MMKSDAMHRHLVELTEKMDVLYREHNFRNAGIAVQSGFCIVKDQKMFVMDKHIRLKEKNRILAAFLAGYPDDDRYILPAVRDFINAQKKREPE